MKVRQRGREGGRTQEGKVSTGKADNSHTTQKSSPYLMFPVNAAVGAFTGEGKRVNGKKGTKGSERAERKYDERKEGRVKEKRGKIVEERGKWKHGERKEEKERKE